MSELPESIKRALEDHAKAREQILSYSPAAEACEAIVKRFKKPSDGLWEGHRASIGWQSGHLTGALYFMDVERAEEITPVLKEFAQLGWHRKKDEPSDFAEIKRRSFLLVHADHKTEITLSAFFIGETCKFVEVGKETTPKYELRCTVEV